MPNSTLPFSSASLCLEVILMLKDWRQWSQRSSFAEFSLLGNFVTIREDITRKEAADGDEVEFPSAGADSPEADEDGVK